MATADSLSSPVHPAWVRLSHWVNAIAVIVLVLSGWRIYNASPIFAFHFARDFTLGGWLGGALLWHFAAMWLLVANGLVYLVANFASGRFAVRFVPLRPAEIIADLRAALGGRLSHGDVTRYNAVQKAAYVGVMMLLIVAVVSGLVVWKSVQFPLLRVLMGGFDNARIVHFVAMAGLVLFFVVHVVMVALVPRTLATMIRGH